MTAAHDQRVTHSYALRYPEHSARADDPHYVDFNHLHKKLRPTARCAMGVFYGDFTHCLDAQGQTLVIDARGQQSGLEMHHKIIEFALLNSVDLALLEKDFPGISDPNVLGAWVESADNLQWLCAWHHRAHGGVHVASAADFSAERYVRDLIA